MSEDKGDGDLDNGGEGGKGDEGDKVDLEALAGTVQGLVSAVSGINENMTTLTQSLQGMADRDAAAGEEDDEEADDQPTNLDDLDRSQFAALLLSKMEKTVSNALKPVTDKVSGVETSVSKSEAANQVKEARAANKDFDEWMPEMKAILSDTPNISLKRALTLARNEDPDKARKMKEKYGDGEGNGKREKGKFGGLAPGSSKTTKDSRMKKGTASESAWEAGLSKLDDPSILLGEV